MLGLENVRGVWEKERISQCLEYMRRVLRGDSGKVKLGPNYAKFYIPHGQWGATEGAAAGGVV